MAAQRGQHVYATLLLNDTYLPGALVLAHSLRDARTTKKLAVMVTLDSVSAESITQLKAVYDYIFPVPRIQNSHPANLYLMNRADLHSAFTKINLWKFTEFSKIVYVDADIVAYRAPDELFDIAHPFSAAPDIGWPDLFNTGVMALTPNMGDYYAMMAMAGRGISFDGADQGLINMHFRNDYHRLSFTYNVTPSAHYQYLPAYRHFQSSINMVHFIGSDKPWFTGRHAPHGNSPYDEMIGRWWAVYDRHYRVQERAPEQQRAPESSLSFKQEHRPQEQAPAAPEYVQYFTKGEFNPQGTTEQEQERNFGEQHHQGHYDPTYAAGSHPSPSFSNRGSQSIPQHHHHNHSPAPSQEQHGQHHNHHHHQPCQDQEQHHEHHDYHHESAPSQEHNEHYPKHHPEHHSEHHSEHYPEHHHDQHQHHHEQGAPVGNPQHHSAPHVSQSAPSSAFDSGQNSGTQAEARSEQQVPRHSHDGGAPPVEQKKPEPPPITMSDWDAQRQPPPADSKPEAGNFPSTHYEMSRDTTHFVPPERYPSPPRDMWYEVPKEKPAPRSQPPPAIFPWEAKQSKPSRYFAEVMPEGPPAPASEEPSTNEPADESTASESITTEVKSEPSTPATPTLKITPADPWSSFSRINAWDEMPEIERYVEGLPWHQRVKSWEKIGRSGGVQSPTTLGKGDKNERQRSFKLTDFPTELERPSLPVTPAPIRRPTFWDGDDTEHGEDGSRRKLPEAEGVPTQSDWDPMEQLKKLAEQQSDLILRKLGGDEEEKSPGVSRGIPSRPLPFGSEDARTTTYVAQSVPGVLSPQPVKGKATTSILRNMGGDTADSLTTLDPLSIPKPSYSGPGAAWERGEDFIQQETPMPPNEEDRDVLDT